MYCSTNFLGFRDLKYQHPCLSMDVSALLLSTKPNRLLDDCFYPLFADILPTTKIAVFLNSSLLLQNLPKQLVLYLYYFFPSLEVSYSIHGGLCALLGELSPSLLGPLSYLKGHIPFLQSKFLLTEGIFFFFTKSFFLYLNGFVVLLKCFKLVLEGFVFFSWS